MASFLPSQDQSFNISVTKEEFNLFHNIDRQLFTRLVVGLGRDTTQSTNVMAFILWVEKKVKDSKMVPNLLQWPDNLLSNLADEAIVVLNCIESSHFPYVTVNENGLPLIQHIMRRAVTLQYFHENRLEIISTVTKLLNHVCLRAFTDIVQQVQYAKAIKEHSIQVANVYGALPLDPFMQQVVYYSPGISLVPQQFSVPFTQWNGGNSNTRNDSHLETYDVSRQQDFNGELSDTLAQLELNDADTVIAASEEKKEVPVDDRTIFLTFSKGYPISESEVREFLTRRYGDVIEAMYMQDVPPPEQPLYARIVIRSEAIPVIDHLLQGGGKVKFVINGKHVWVRKYVRKSPPSPSEPGTSY